MVGKRSFPFWMACGVYEILKKHPDRAVEAPEILTYWIYREFLSCTWATKILPCIKGWTSNTIRGPNWWLHKGMSVKILAAWSPASRDLWSGLTAMYNPSDKAAPFNAATNTTPSSCSPRNRPPCMNSNEGPTAMACLSKPLAGGRYLAASTAFGKLSRTTEKLALTEFQNLAGTLMPNTLSSVSSANTRNHIGQFHVFVQEIVSRHRAHPGHSGQSMDHPQPNCSA